MIKTAVYL